MNEYITLFLVTLAFPTMFPDACGDLPTQLCYEMYNSQKESNTSSSLEKKKVPNGIIALPHTQDLPTGHLIQLKERKQNPGEAHLTTEELKQMASTNNIGTLTKVSSYLGNISGSDAHWQKAKEDLKAVISHVGPATLFFTFWSELHALFGHSSEICHQLNVTIRM